MMELDREVVLRTLKLFHPGNDIIELRIPKAGKFKTISGYFSDHKALADALIGLDGDGFQAYYFTLNPINPDLLARSKNKIKRYVDITTADSDILKLKWLKIDFDPLRPAGISATNQEHDNAIELARDVKRWVIEKMGWPDSFILADSGNGGHLLAPIDLPNTKENIELEKQCLEALDFVFSTEAVRIDVTTFNPARIWKIYGTPCRKGSNTEDRPWRIAKILEVSSDLSPIPRELLEALADILPKEDLSQSKSIDKEFDPGRFAENHGSKVMKTKSWQGWTLAILQECPFNPEHNRGEARIGVLRNGAKYFGCFHEGCKNENWQSLKKLWNIEVSMGAGTGDQKEKKQSAATNLITIALTEIVELWKTSDSLLYATIKINEHLENYQLESKQFKQWLSRLYYIERKKSPLDQVLKDTIRVLGGVAQFEGKTYDAFSRVGYKDGIVYVDLCQESWNSIKITPEGWQIINNTPIKFVRNAEMLPLPIPEEGGNWNDLDLVIGDIGAENKIIMRSWLIQGFWPVGPYTHLVLNGEPGALKTFTEKILKELIDPSKAPLTGKPANMYNFLIQAKWARIVALDNLSGILDGQFSDALCTLSTGIGMTTRKLYTEFDQSVMEVKRPVVMNGIDIIIPRGDLNDRVLFITLPKIDEWKKESECWQQFLELRPKLLGLILDATVQGLKDEIKLDTLPVRMADFAAWIMNCEKALPWEPGKFLEVYQDNHIQRVYDQIEVDPFARALMGFMDGYPLGYRDSCTQLLKSLEALNDFSDTRSDAWPKDGTRLSTKVRRISSLFRKIGFEISISRTNKQRNIEITRISTDPKGNAEGDAGDAKIFTASPQKREQQTSSDANDAGDANSYFLDYYEKKENKEKTNTYKLKEIDFASQASPQPPACDNSDISASPQRHLESKDLIDQALDVAIEEFDFTKTMSQNPKKDMKTPEVKEMRKSRIIDIKQPFFVESCLSFGDHPFGTKDLSQFENICDGWLDVARMTGFLEEIKKGVYVVSSEHVDAWKERSKNWAKDHP
ncbi:MAG: hypothetical protein MUO26_05405 [Methanotrichaceae archaeon]|nr:hypothetical protein [Methanotrichaceae archaeon]